jgi:hypothetical protein
MSANEAEELREKVDALEAENERLRARVRVMGCGYCGATILEFSPGDPVPSEAIEAFREHDAACPKNPLAARLRAYQEGEIARGWWRPVAGNESEWMGPHEPWSGSPLAVRAVLVRLPEPEEEKK